MASAGHKGGGATHARFAPMDELRLRFCDGEQPDLALGAGVHALGRLPHGLGPVDSTQAYLLQLCNDQRGIWLTVADGLRGVHVNGRPVQHVAMLRAGDSIHVDGNELQLMAALRAATLAPASGAPRDPATNLRFALRGLGGAHHGRSISLEQPRRIGRAADADIRIDGPGIADQHALVEALNGQAVLHETSADVLVNGQRVREAILQAGDQIAFDVQHRFVLEGPPPQAASASSRLPPAFADDADASPRPPRTSWPRRMPWLLIAALLLAAALSGLLLFGTH